MGFIQCALNCKYQKEGFCNLEKCSTVNSVNDACPYFESADNVECFFKVSYTDKGDPLGNGGYRL